MVEHLPPGAMCVQNDIDAVALETWMAGMRPSLGLDRGIVRAAAEFATGQIADRVLAVLEGSRVAV